MRPAIFLDTNVPIYVAGSEHPYKRPCARVLRMAARNPDSFITDAEVLQELIHRYLSLGRWEVGREVFRRFYTVMEGRIEPVSHQDAQLAAELADRHQGANARDLIHTAIMQRLGSEHIISSDRDFDRIPGITRLDPLNVAEWEALVLGGES